MNVGIVTTWFERGAAYVSRQYVDSLSYSNDVYIYARGGEKYAIDDKNWNSKNVTWGKTDDSNIITYVELSDFKNWIISNKLDCVFFNEQWYWEPIILCKEMDIKVGAYIDYYTNATKEFFEIYDFVICNTKRHYEVFKDHPQAFYIPWGTDVDLFKPTNSGIVENGCVTFFHSAGYAPFRKGTDKVLAAVNKIKSNRNFKLIIHSQIDIENLSLEIKNIIDELKKSGKLEIINKTIHAPGLYHMGDIYVYPSRLDGIGLTLAEALSCGLPIIVSDNAPMSEFAFRNVSQKVKVDSFHTREDGYYWPMCEVNTDDLAKKMEYYIENIDVIPNLKKKARFSAEKKLNWKDRYDLINDIFLKTRKFPLKKNLITKIRNYDLKNIPFSKKLDMFCENINKINNRIKLINKDDEVIVYGAGEHTELLLKYTNLKEKNIKYIVDKNFKNINKELFKYAVLNPKILNKEKDSIVVISSLNYVDEIYNFLKKDIKYLGKIITLYDSDDKYPFYLG